MTRIIEDTFYNIEIKHTFDLYFRLHSDGYYETIQRIRMWENGYIELSACGIVLDYYSMHVSPLKNAIFGQFANGSYLSVQTSRRFKYVKNDFHVQWQSSTKQKVMGVSVIKDIAGHHLTVTKSGNCMSRSTFANLSLFMTEWDIFHDTV